MTEVKTNEKKPDVRCGSTKKKIVVWGITVIHFILLISSIGMFINQKPESTGKNGINIIGSTIQGDVSIHDNGSISNIHGNISTPFEHLLSIAANTLGMVAGILSINGIGNDSKKAKNHLVWRTQIWIVITIILLIVGIVLSILKATHGNGETTQTPIPPSDSISSQASEITHTPNPPIIRGWNGESYQYILLGVYTQNSSTKTPIKWRILSAENDHALLLSESILDAGRFDYDTNRWENSIMKDWLNNEFMYIAFSAAERNAIISSNETGTVFLLSASEYISEGYGFAQNSKAKDPNRIALGTPYAQDLGLQIVSGSQGQGAYYTRTSSGNKNVIIYRGDGSIASCKPDRTNVGIRPAICIETSTLEFDQSSGSFDDPLKIRE